MGELVIDYPRAFGLGAGVAGGKGFNLARLDRYGFAVPKGGVVTADAYVQAVRAPAVRELVERLAPVAGERALAPDTVALLSEVRRALVAEPLAAPLASELETFLADTGLSALPVAVRSSATTEDGCRASFAGVHQSVLGVRGVADVTAAVKTCWASLFSPEALAYRRRLGLSEEDVLAAVVICAMVGGPSGVPLAAGVAFTCDPVTGRRDQVVINAVTGLAEALVQGDVAPATWTAELDHGDISRASGGPGPLSEGRVLELARLARRVEAALGDGSQPQDIEWAHDGERFWLVQARPIVRVPRPSGVRRFPTLWSNANVTEGLPSVVSELTWSGTSALINRQFFSLLAATGYAVPRGVECVRRIHGRAYIDLTLMQWLYYDALGVLPADLNVLTGGLQPALALPEDPFAGEPGQRRRLANLRLLPKLLLSRWRYPGRIARFLEEARALAGQDFSALSAGELFDLCTREAGRVGTFFPGFMMGNANLELTLLCQLIERWIKGRGYAIAGALMAGLGKVVSADHGTALYGLARAAKADPPAHALLMEPRRAAAEWRSLVDGSPFKRAFEGFLAEYGHRAVEECDVANPRWQEDPRFVFEQLRPLLTSEPAHDLGARAKRARRSAEVALVAVPFIVRPVLRALARRAQRNAALREAAKSALMAALLVTRRLALVIGERLAEAERIGERDDVFFLSWGDVTAYLRGEWGGEGARQLIADRKERHARWLSTPASSVYTDAAPEDTATTPGLVASTTVAAQTVADGVPRLVGFGVSPGRIRGRARVVRSPDEAARLAAGEILVAPSTNPGWTPLFVRAGAVAVEVGGYLSHGAIVAREYGLPAVVNVPGLVDDVVDGEEIVVDGDLGLVIFVDRPPVLP
jgi:pyruvate,water dikinase